eukprot:986463-Prymnesium_polylepis.1
MLRETDGTWDNGYTHARFVRHSGYVGLCISRRPAFSHGARPRPAPSRAAVKHHVISWCERTRKSLITCIPDFI